MPIDNYRVVRAIGDGNCAFNAFILGFCQKTALDRVELLFADENNPIHHFYHAVGTMLEVERESLTEGQYLKAVKEKILELREHNASKLQKTLAPYMRRLACDLKYPESAKADFIPALQGAYFGIKAKANLSILEVILAFFKKSDPDDIFSQHPSIMAKFKELSALSPQQSDEADQAELESWWNDRGFGLFVAKMKRSGSWAGDAELAALAKHFHINLQIRTPHYARQFHYEYGELQRDQLSPALIDQLVKRNVIISPEEHQTALPFILQPVEIRARLEAVPDVAERIAALPDGIIQGLPADGFPEGSIDQLKKRGVITPARNVPGVSDGTLLFQGQKQFAVEAIKPISDDPVVIDSIVACIHDKSPVIALENLGGHWNLLTKTMASEPQARKGLEDNGLEASTEKWTKWREEIEDKYKNRVGVSQSESVAYTLYNADGGEKIIHVTKDEQIAGDEVLARKLQEEEFAAGGRRRP